MASIDQTATAALLVCWARGDSDSKVFTLKDADAVVIDISANAYKLTVNTEKDPDPVGPPVVGVEQFTVTGSFVTDGTDGEIGFAPTAVNTDITPGTYFYDIQETDGGGAIRTLIKGKCKIVQDITK